MPVNTDSTLRRKAVVWDILWNSLLCSGLWREQSNRHVLIRIARIHQLVCKYPLTFWEMDFIVCIAIYFPPFLMQCTIMYCKPPSNYSILSFAAYVSKFFMFWFYMLTLLFKIESQGWRMWYSLTNFDTSQ